MKKRCYFIGSFPKNSLRIPSIHLVVLGIGIPAGIGKGAGSRPNGRDREGRAWPQSRLRASRGGSFLIFSFSIFLYRFSTSR